MDLTAILLALSLFRSDAPALRDSLAPVILRIGRTPEEQAFLIADAEHETHFAAYVLEGRCLDGPKGARCDPGKDGVPRAVGAWQVWKRYCRDQSPEGQARCVLSQARLGLSRCASWEGAFAALKTGGCKTADSARRVQTMRRILKAWGQ